MLGVSGNAKSKGQKRRVNNEMRPNNSAKKDKKKKKSRVF